ncbi:MAG: exodeoxyribonuclease V subunit alpha [Spirochaetes bacterium]|nr:exodeoxyribonuclease V subunit alpha [Spirochaetota bacterium]
MNHNAVEYLSSISELGKEFYRFLRDQGAEHFVALAGCAICHRIAEGNTCVDISEIAGCTIAKIFHLEEQHEVHMHRVPEFEEYIDLLRKSPLVGLPGEIKPLILEKTRLYLYRYWKYEQMLAQNILKRLSKVTKWIDEALLREKLLQYFPDHDDGSINYQRVAAFRALTSNFTVITGGPGTGKTSTVAKIIAIMLEIQSEEIVITLAAPTGKAAYRIKESIEHALLYQEILRNLPDRIKLRFPKEAFTIHRLLGSVPASPYFRFNAENQLKCDVIVIDESSMVDLALMAKLFEAIPENANVILLGDRDQLASVEAGSVLGDICGDVSKSMKFSRDFAVRAKRVTGYSLPVLENDYPLCDAIIYLQKSYRFGSGIANFAEDINKSCFSCIRKNLKSNGYENVTVRPIVDLSSLKRALQALVDEGMWDFLLTDDVGEAIRKLYGVAILCAHRRGPWGSEQISAFIEWAIKCKTGNRDVWRGLYDGKPIMIVKNSYELNLFNGDIGIVRKDEKNQSELFAYFPDEKNSSVRKISIYRLPEFDSAYAFTVHKSQGSEFSRVIFIIPPQYTSILSKELLYTAVTRGRNEIEIWGDVEIFLQAVNQPIRRFSGLCEAIWNSQCA